MYYMELLLNHRDGGDGSIGTSGTGVVVLRTAIQRFIYLEERNSFSRRPISSVG
jgi:hypothetical protein